MSVNYSYLEIMLETRPQCPNLGPEPGLKQASDTGAKALNGRLVCELVLVIVAL